VYIPADMNGIACPLPSLGSNLGAKTPRGGERVPATRGIQMAAKLPRSTAGGATWGATMGAPPGRTCKNPFILIFFVSRKVLRCKQAAFWMYKYIILW